MKEYASDFPFHPEKWIVATRYMTREERGDYIDLLCFQWNYDGLPENLDEIARLIGLKNGKKLSKNVIEKFPIIEGKRRNIRLEQERENQIGRIEKYRDKIAKMNAARASKDGSKDTSTRASTRSSTRASSILKTQDSITQDSSLAEDKSSVEREAASRPTSRKKQTHPNPASSREECQRFAIEIGSHWRDGDAFWDTMEESGWTKKDGKVPVLDWKKTMRKWVSSGWLPSAKATLNWSEPPPWEQIQHTSEEEFIPGPSDKDDIRTSMAKAREENRRIESGECELELISEE